MGKEIKKNADYWFSVRNLCRFPTKGKERCKYMPILNNNNNNKIISKNSHLFLNYFEKVLSENKKPRLYNRGFCCGPIRTSGLDQVDLIFRSGTPQSIFLDADCGFSVRNLCKSLPKVKNVIKVYLLQITTILTAIKFQKTEFFILMLVARKER
jgi:hypothetical protein